MIPMLIVVSFSDEAAALQRTLDPSKREIMVIHPGEPLLGHRFHRILVATTAYQHSLGHSEEKRRRYQDWIASSVRTKVGPDGTVSELY